VPPPSQLEDLVAGDEQNHHLINGDTGQPGTVLYSLTVVCQRDAQHNLIFYSFNSQIIEILRSALTVISEVSQGGLLNSVAYFYTQLVVFRLITIRISHSLIEFCSCIMRGRSLRMTNVNTDFSFSLIAGLCKKSG